MTEASQFRLSGSADLQNGLRALSEGASIAARDFFVRCLHDPDGLVVTRARLELAHLELQAGNVDAAAGLLVEAERGASAAADAKLLLEVTAAWRMVGREDLAELGYENVVAMIETRELDKLADPSGMRHFHAALAYLKLAELAGDHGDDEGEYHYYSLAVDQADARISPLAAIELAVCESIQDSESSQVEWLLRDAFTSGHPVAAPEAAYELACVLHARDVEGDVHDLLAFARDASNDPVVAQRAAAALAGLSEAFEGRVRTPSLTSRAKVMLVRAPRRVLLASGGTGAQYCARDLMRDDDSARYELVGFLDDNTTSGPVAAGVARLGALDEASAVIARENVHEVWITMPRVAPKTKRRLALSVLRTGARLRTLPVMHELAKNPEMPLHRQLRDVRVDDIAGESDALLDVDVAALSGLSHARILIVGCGTLGAQLALAGQRAGAASITLVDRRDEVLRRLEHTLTRMHLAERVTAHQGSGIDRDLIPSVAAAEGATHVFYTASGWGRAGLDGARIGRVLSGLQDLSDGLRSLPHLRQFVFTSLEQSTRSESHALDFAAESVLLGSPDESRATRLAVRAPATYTSTQSVLGRLAHDVESGLPVIVPPPPVLCRFEHAFRVAELVLHAAQVAEDGDVFGFSDGDDVSLFELARWMLLLNGHSDRLIVDKAFVIDDVPRPVGEPLLTAGLVRLVENRIPQADLDELARHPTVRRLLHTAAFANRRQHRF